MIRSNLYAYPQRITEAREARKYNMTQLADLLGVTKQAVSRYELNLSHPSNSVISKMAEVLDFPERFFYKPSHAESTDSTIFFRTFKSSEATERSMIQVKCRWTSEAYSYLNRYVKMPTLNLPPVEFLINKTFLSDSDIEEIARITRQHWKLGSGPIDNLTYVMEKNGIVISGSPIDGDKTDACSMISNGTPIVFCNKNLRSACRIRFSLAHELGHILMHSHVTKDDIKNAEFLKGIESQANHFASALLLPDETFSADIRSLSLNYFVMLKEKWRTSIASMIYRCKDLELIDPNTYETMYRQLSYKRWRKVEPLDDAIPIEPPKLLKSAIEFVTEIGNISKQQIIHDFCWEIRDLVEIFGTAPSFFNEESDFRPHLQLL
ncbi:ImmA/IrrE family metallo-endopeptidase [Agathobaculum sp. NSJ-28]|uniref:ImmA/IrrE family metallo-endopeptidase n=1 Tax=Agathobaculum faecis TaxID=2763013 RepID=A0A923LWA4_9FIRM|nr:XRE family transcriptional regulator [Agathobaculum faecis]MBC5725853.1 ImmA/IrrE family metallo-endopeptidase [Agathobaculum faecis]